MWSVLSVGWSKIENKLKDKINEYFKRDNLSASIIID